MRHLLWAMVVCGVATMSVGCGQMGAGPAAEPAAQSGKVAIVDLDEVARRIGRAEEMDAAVVERQQEINADLAKLQAGYVKQFETEREKLGEDATDEEQQKLARYGAELDQKFNVTRQQRSGELAGYRQDLIQQFREDVRPIAQTIAGDRGMTIVVTKNDTVIYAYEPDCDITDAVAAKMGVVKTARKRAAQPDYLPEESVEEDVAPLSADADADEEEDSRYR
ncbi:MAG: OmpH family outer membrane protein [Pirellulales bacterium]